MELRATEADRRAGPLWFEQWRALRRARNRAVVLAAIALLALGQAWSGLGTTARVALAIVAFAAAVYALVAPRRLTAMIPSQGTGWLPEWRAHRRRRAAYALTSTAVLAIALLSVERFGIPHGWLRISLAVAGALVAVFIALALSGLAAEASEQAKKRVPDASDTDVLERWRREDEAAERAEAAARQAQQRAADRARRREERRQEDWLRMARAQALRRGGFLHRELVVPLRGNYVPLEELERKVRNKQWRIVEVQPSYYTVYTPAVYGPSSNALLAAAGHSQKKSRGSYTRFPLDWSVQIQEL